MPTTHLQIPYLSESQSQKVVQINQNSDIIDAMPASTVLIGTLAARPAAGWAGRLYVATDVGNEGLYRDTGSVWTMCLLGAGAHLNLAGGTAPTAAAGANAGTSPPAPIVTAGSNDVRGNCTFGTGTSPANGAMAVVTFAVAYATAPIVIVSGRNANTTNIQPYVFAAATGSFTIGLAAVPGGSLANTFFSVNYLVIQ